MPNEAVILTWPCSPRSMGISARPRRSRSITGTADCDGRVRQHQHELLAAVAADLVVAAEVADEVVGDGAEHLVAGLVAEGVVDGLEVVEIDHADAAGLAGAADPVALLLQPRQHGEARRDPGQRVGEAKQIPQLLDQRLEAVVEAVDGAGEAVVVRERDLGCRR